MAFEIRRGTFLKFALVKRIEHTTFGNRLKEMGSQKKKKAENTMLFLF